MPPELCPIGGGWAYCWCVSIEVAAKSESRRGRPRGRFGAEPLGICKTDKVITYLG
jgi:hypothetical protein